MSSLTVEELKAALQSNGIDLPSPKARKKEYIRLYRKHIAPLRHIASEFSSDDDSQEDSPRPRKSVQRVDRMSQMDPDDVNSLDDDELSEHLTSFGVSVGPVVDSTRALYRKKLIRLLGGDVVDSPYGNEEVDLDEYSAEEEDHDQKLKKSSPGRSKRETDSTTSISRSPRLRQRLVDEREASSSYHHSTPLRTDLHTPSPRPSLRTVTTSTVTTTTKYMTPGGSTYLRTTTDEKVSDGFKKALSKFLVKVLMLIIFVGIFYVLYQYYNSESPLEGLEQLARQALDAHEGKASKEGTKDTRGGPGTPKVKSPKTS